MYWFTEEPHRKISNSSLLMFGIVRFMIMTAGMCNVNKLECLFLKGSGLFITWLKKQDK